MSDCVAFCVAVPSSAALSPRCATRSRTLRSASVAEPGLERLGVVGQLGHDHLAGGRQFVAVGVLQHRVDELAERHVELLVDDPRAHPADAAAAHDEQLHRGGELVVVDAEHVEVDASSPSTTALFSKNAVARLQLVAPARRGLVVLRGRGVLHLPA